MPIARTYEEVDKLIYDCGYNLIEEYWVDKQRRIIFMDKLGYKYDGELSKIIFSEKDYHPQFVGSRNPYSLENISLWLKLNRNNFELAEGNEYTTSIEGNLIFYCHDCKDFCRMGWGNMYSGMGCGVCYGQQVGKYNNLEYLRSDLIEEWDYKKNKIKPNSVTLASGVYVYWICKDCKHSWNTRICRRTINNSGCPACAGKVVTDRNRLSILYPKVASEWHPSKNGKLKPKDFSFGSNKDAWFKCSYCEHEWKTRIAHRTKGTGCPKCRESLGEKKISEILEKLNVQYCQQKDFPGCVYEKQLWFDFYLDEYNLCIEFNGEQHYKLIRNNYFGGQDSLNKRIARDKIKQDYCYNNGIPLLIIPYTEFDQIEKILIQTFNELEGGT